MWFTAFPVTFMFGNIMSFGLDNFVANNLVRWSLWHCAKINHCPGYKMTHLSTQDKPHRMAWWKLQSRLSCTIGIVI